MVLATLALINSHRIKIPPKKAQKKLTHSMATDLKEGQPRNWPCTSFSDKHTLTFLLRY